MTTTEPRDWLVLSLKWTWHDSDWVVWYRPEAKGYTIDLAQAGRYTEAEARNHEGSPDTLAVPEWAARGMARTMTVIPSESVLVARLRMASNEKERS